MGEDAPEDREAEGARATRSHLMAGVPLRLPDHRHRVLRAARPCGGQLASGIASMDDIISQFTDARPINGTRPRKGQKWTKFQLVLFDVLKPGLERPYLVKGLI